MRSLAFVLGGGGVLGAHEVGMLRALAERGVSRTSFWGTSIGAVNGAFFAADPTLGGRRAPGRAVAGRPAGRALGRGRRPRLTTLASTGTHLESLRELRERLADAPPGPSDVEDLPLPFQCVAASIERAAEHWFDAGQLADVLLASRAVPGILPPVRIDDEHFIDGGIVNSIPVAARCPRRHDGSTYSRSAAWSSRCEPPRRPWEVALSPSRLLAAIGSPTTSTRCPRTLSCMCSHQRHGRPGLQRPAGQLRVRRTIRTVQQQIEFGP